MDYKNKNEKWIRFFGSFFYLGNLKGGGTYTSLVVSLIVFFLIPWNSTTYILVLIIGTLIAILLSLRLDNDPTWYTLDELSGTLVTFAFHTRDVKTLIIGLLVFRIMDIFKLPLIKKTESLKIGVVLDDIIAGLIASCFLWILDYIPYF